MQFLTAGYDGGQLHNTTQDGFQHNVHEPPGHIMSSAAVMCYSGRPQQPC